jgi:putative SOS response-associated peptidase YedK
MCSRYVSPDTASIEHAWRIGNSGATSFARRFNVLPDTRIPVLRADPARRLFLLDARWGFVPPWWKQATPPTGCFNARAEEAAHKPMWRHSYRTERCLIPADGWYEWSGVERVDAKTGEVQSRRQPHFIFRPEGPVCFAGLMSLWKLNAQLPVITCAILTRTASTSLSHIHARMPVVLPPPLFEDWLHPDLQEPDALIGQAMSEFSQYPVSAELNNAKHDAQELVNPIAL